VIDKFFGEAYQLDCNAFFRFRPRSDTWILLAWNATIPPISHGIGRVCFPSHSRAIVYSNRSRSGPVEPGQHDASGSQNLNTEGVSKDPSYSNSSSMNVEEGGSGMSCTEKGELETNSV
jgi:hypothetical protein